MISTNSTKKTVLSCPGHINADIRYFDGFRAIQKPKCLGFLILFLCFLFSNSCSGKKSFPEGQAEKLFLQAGDTLRIKYELLTDISLSRELTQNIWKAPVKILSFVDGGCSMCGYTLGKWKAFIEKYALGWGVPVIIIASGKSREKIRYMAFDQLNYTFPLFYDSTNHVTNINHIINDPDFNTFLLDANNRIRLMGSPIENNHWFSLYMQEVNKLKSR